VRSDHLVDRDVGRLRAPLDRYPELAAAAQLVLHFADMLTSLPQPSGPERLDSRYVDG